MGYMKNDFVLSYSRWNFALLIFTVVLCKLVLFFELEN